jgi:hypothetical protein
MTEEEFDNLNIGHMVQSVYDKKRFVVCGKMEECKYPNFSESEPSVLIYSDICSEKYGWELCIIKKSKIAAWKIYHQQVHLNMARGESL